MFKTKNSNNKKSEDVKKSAGKVLDTKKDTPTRAKVKKDILINIIEFYTPKQFFVHIPVGSTNSSNFIDLFYRLT